MFFTIAAVFSVLTVLCYWMMMRVRAAPHTGYILDVQQFLFLVRNQLFVGGDALVIRFCQNVAGDPLAWAVRDMIRFREDPARLDAIEADAAETAQEIAQEIGRFRPGLALWHLVFAGAFAGILYADGVTTGWVIVLLTLAALTAGVCTWISRADETAVRDRMLVVPEHVKAARAFIAAAEDQNAA